MGDVVARTFEVCLYVLRAASVPMRYPGLLQVILPLHLVEAKTLIAPCVRDCFDGPLLRGGPSVTINFATVHCAVLGEAFVAIKAPETRLANMR